VKGCSGTQGHRHDNGSGAAGGGANLKDVLGRGGGGVGLHLRAALPDTLKARQMRALRDALRIPYGIRPALHAPALRPTGPLHRRCTASGRRPHLPRRRAAARLGGGSEGGGGEHVLTVVQQPHGRRRSSRYPTAARRCLRSVVRSHGAHTRPRHGLTRPDAVRAPRPRP
jgi:hypothetical protein